MREMHPKVRCWRNRWTGHWELIEDMGWPSDMDDPCSRYHLLWPCKGYWGEPREPGEIDMDVLDERDFRKHGGRRVNEVIRGRQKRAEERRARAEANDTQAWASDHAMHMQHMMGKRSDYYPGFGEGAR
jgi:hypothetical protein